jgi:peptide/nickel transport system substrate-binding protein
LTTDPTDPFNNIYGGVTPYFTNILEPLVWVTGNMELTPWLATDWTAPGDRTWEFTLRDDVTFHNGEPLTANAVVFSFEQILEEWVWSHGWLHLEPGNVRALDERTVEFTTTDPFPSFPGTIAHNMVAIQHPDRTRDGEAIVGTGPFRVTERTQGKQVRTERFDKYWNGSTTVSELTFDVITDANTRTLALQNDEVDVAFEPPKSKIEALRENESIDVVTELTPTAGFVGCNIHREPTDDPKLRQALNHAVSQSTLVDTVLAGIGEPARSPIAESIYWSAHETVPHYQQNRERASELVEESSYDGEELSLYVNTQLVDGRLIAQALQQWFAEVGVTVSIQVLEDAAWDDGVRNGKAHLVLDESGTNSGAADYLIYEAFHSDGDMNQRLSRSEGTGLYNLGSEVDSLIEKGFQTADTGEKERLYEDALVKVMEEAVVVPLYYGEYVTAIRSDLTSLDLRPIPEMVRWTSLKRT